ncbi:MAG: tRNA (adenosine(37)-N6)-dimethylallyltransferase MiaA [Bacteroidales bacterium]|nr:tRNA (adenosine(37)-N6)-dimethylallyltransferase MiaA [Bacteroidales bacterium]
MAELVIVLGPTAVGKTDYSIDLALGYGSPVISCDSRQIYREMKIGTAPPSDEQLARVKHYFIGTRSVTDPPYTAGRYELDALALLEELFREHDTLVMAGGSGLYIDALCDGLDDFPDVDPSIRAGLMERLEKEGLEALRFELRRLDPATFESIDTANRQRVVRALEVCIGTGRPFSSFKTSAGKTRPFTIRKIGLTRPRQELYDRINRRVDLMMEAGLEAEARSLLKYRDLPALNTVGYRELFGYFDGKYPLEEAVRLIKRNTRHYAKKQLTYWGRDDSIEWITL